MMKIKIIVIVWNMGLFNEAITTENAQIKEAIFRTLITNGMFDNTHIRLSLTRGKKVLITL
jgi:hypothetical protein